MSGRSWFQKLAKSQKNTKMVDVDNLPKPLTFVDPNDAAKLHAQPQMSLVSANPLCTQPHDQHRKARSFCPTDKNW